MISFLFWPKKTVTKRKNIQRYNHRSIGRIYRFFLGALGSAPIRVELPRGGAWDPATLQPRRGGRLARTSRYIVGVVDKGERDRSYPGEEGVQAPYPRTAVMAPRCFRYPSLSNINAFFAFLSWRTTSSFTRVGGTNTFLSHLRCSYLRHDWWSVLGPPILLAATCGDFAD